MASAESLHAEIAGLERAIRHLIGERKALTSTLDRDEALLKLAERKLHAISTRNHPAVGPVLPSGSRFPDVSSFQPNVDWNAVRHASSIRVGDLAIVKISEGAGWTDPYGAARWREMASAGFPHRGGYHFLHPSVSPQEQAQHFLSALHQDGVIVRPSDIVVCDCEVSDSSSSVAACTREFGQIVRKEVPAKLWLYGGGPFLHEFGVELEPYDGHWLAAYVSDPAPYMVFGRSRTVAWQYSDGHYGPTPHYCPGIGSCDLSVVL